MLRAFLDTCVLFKPILCDTLLSIAEDEVAHQDKFLAEATGAGFHPAEARRGSSPPRA